MKKLYMKTILVFGLIFSFASMSFDYSLQYHGMNAAKIKAMGCGCDSQLEVDAFLSEFYSRVARELQKRNNSIPVGILRASSGETTGFFGSFSQSVSNWLVAGDSKAFDRVIVFVNWPEFNH